MSIPFKPRSSPVRTTLKQFKDAFDDPSLDGHELLTEFNVRRALTEPLKAYQGEFLHQLALRKERRGEFAHAERLYRLSFQALTGNPLGQARTARDYGTMLVAHVDPVRGFELIQTARKLHALDVDNQKSRRQRLITESYLWRAQVLAGSPAEARNARRQLIALVDGPDFDFCLRDQKVIVDFLVPRTRGDIHRSLLARQIAMHLERRHRLHLVGTSARLLIDIELSILGSIARRFLRKE